MHQPFKEEEGTALAVHTPFKNEEEEAALAVQGCRAGVPGGGRGAGPRRIATSSRSTRSAAHDGLFTVGKLSVWLFNVVELTI